VVGKKRRQHAVPRGVTVKDVAQRAGVSTATVSRVVNGNPRVGTEVKAAVTIAIEELGYVPNPSARSLMTHRTGSIGVVILESADRLFGDPFFGQLMLGISAALADRDRRLVLMLAPDRAEEARTERYIVGDHVDGIVLVGPHGADPLMNRLVRRGVPMVVSGRPVGHESVSYVDAHNRTGAEAAVRHLIEHGRTSIGTIYGTLDLPSAADRLEGYRDALRAAGRPIDASLEVSGEYRARTAADAIAGLLERHPELDALFAASDSMAIAAMQAIKDSGRRVPEDVAVVGFDDLPTAEEVRPTLSTVRQPIEAMGREMVRLVLQQIDEPGSAANQVVFSTKLILRESTGDAAPPAAAVPAGTGASDRG